MTRPRIGLALGSGSARGWAHIGVIDSLIEAGIEPDIVCGTSIGALVGAAYVAGQLARCGNGRRRRPGARSLRLTDVRLSGGGLISGRQVVVLPAGDGHRPADRELRTQYAAVATDLATGREIWLQSGPIHEAVRASIALPGILSPARHRRPLAGRRRPQQPDSRLGLPRARRRRHHRRQSQRRPSGPTLRRRADPSTTMPSRRLGRGLPAQGDGPAARRAAAARRRRRRPTPPPPRETAAGLFRRSGHLAQHHAGPHHAHPPGRRAAACHAGAAPAQHRPDGIQPRRRGDRRRPRLRRAGVADVETLPLALPPPSSRPERSGVEGPPLRKRSRDEIGPSTPPFGLRSG